MFPLIIVAFAGIGVTRLALLALELHESNNPEEATPPSASLDKETAIEEMRRLEKPKKLILKNDCQFVCIWKDEDLEEDLPMQDLLENCAAKRGIHNHLILKPLQDLTSFWRQIFAMKAQASSAKPVDRSRNDGSQGARVGRRDETHPRRDSGLITLREGEGRGRVGVGRSEEVVDGKDGLRMAPVMDLDLSRSESASSVGSMGANEDAALLVPNERASPIPTTRRTPSPRPASNSSDDICLVCCDNQQDAVLLTCGHGSICFSCAIDVYRTTRECPLCRSKVDQIVTVGPKTRLLCGLQVVSVTGPS